MLTIEVLDLVTPYADEKNPERIAYWTLPEVLFPRVGERVMKFLDTQSRPEGVLGNYYDALIMIGGPDVIRVMLGVAHADALKMSFKEQHIRDNVLEILRLWFTEELASLNEGKPIKLWIKIGPESYKYKLTVG